MSEPSAPVAPSQVEMQPMGGGNPPPPPGMPTVTGWMAAPTVAEGTDIPPGLEYLTQLDQILVHQVVELLEAFSGFETDNKYAIKNMMGQQCYYALEESGCCAKQCCKNRRGFTMKIVDNNQREVIRATRVFKCCGNTCCWITCCGCMQHEITVESPPGIVIGRLYNKCSFWRQTFSLDLGPEEASEPILEVVGPCCISRAACCACCDITFDVKSATTGDVVGHLKKQYSGMAKEMFTDADNFSVSFPKDLDVRAKALLICSVFMVDFLFFEDNQQTKVTPKNALA